MSGSVSVHRKRAAFIQLNLIFLNTNTHIWQNLTSNLYGGNIKGKKQLLDSETRSSSSFFYFQLNFIKTRNSLLNIKYVKHFKMFVFPSFAILQQLKRIKSFPQQLIRTKPSEKLH